VADTLRIKRLTPTAKPPQRMTDGAAGLDLYADGHPGQRYVLGGYYCRKIPTGIAIEIPRGFVGLIRGRSSLPARGVYCIEGTVDSDYRGEVHVQLRGEEMVKAGERIAQIVIVPSPLFELVEADELTETARGTAGFGSTDGKAGG
jgi:dUTP pyrophosphatase